MKFAFIFPGQGSQKAGMGREIYDNFESAKSFLDGASKHCAIDFNELLFKENENLNISEFTQPAIVANSLICFLATKEKLSSRGLNLNAELMLGHSLGEFSALGVANGIDKFELLNLVRNRGKFMQDSCADKDASMMVILGLSDEKVNEIIAQAQASNLDVWVANFNCDGQIVIAGNRAHLTKLESEFKQSGAKRTMLLNMSVASHCPMLQSASENLAPFLENSLKCKFAPVISNVNAKIYTTKTEAVNLLKLQLVSPVLYKQSVEFAAQNIDCFVEFGANVLKGINKKITDKPTFSIFDMASLDEFVEFALENSVLENGDNL